MAKETQTRHERQLERIRTIREYKKQGLRIKQIADKMGLTEASISSYWTRRHLLETEENDAIETQQPDIPETPEKETTQAPSTSEAEAESDENEKSSSSPEPSILEPSQEVIDSTAKTSREKKISDLRNIQKSIAAADVHYLVDTENISTSAMEDMINNLSPNEMIHFFYTEKSARLTFGIMQALIDKQEQVHFLRCFAGDKNALDFQIVSVFGMMMGTENIDQKVFYLVTNDRGFDAAIDFWATRGVEVYRSNGYDNYKEALTQTDDNSNNEPSPQEEPEKSVVMFTHPSMLQQELVKACYVYQQWPAQVLRNACEMIAMDLSMHASEARYKSFRHAVPCVIGADFKKKRLQIKKVHALMDYIIAHPEYQYQNLLAFMNQDTAEHFIKIFPKPVVQKMLIEIYEKYILKIK